MVELVSSSLMDTCLGSYQLADWPVGYLAPDTPQRLDDVELQYGDIHECNEMQDIIYGLVQVPSHVHVEHILVANGGRIVQVGTPGTRAVDVDEPQEDWQGCGKWKPGECDEVEHHEQTYTEYFGKDQLELVCFRKSS